MPPKNNPKTVPAHSVRLGWRVTMLGQTMRIIGLLLDPLNEDQIRIMLIPIDADYGKDMDMPLSLVVDSDYEIEILTD